jgi:predicted metal-binding membrane protein
MAIFVGVGAMSIPWAVAIAAVVLVEKVFPQGVLFSRALGGILIGAAIFVLLRPDLVPAMTEDM